MLEEPDLRYPIGKVKDQLFADKTTLDEEAKEAHLVHIKMLPQLLEYAVVNLDAAQLETPYRPGGWTIQQVVHHVADSHMNAYMRFKLGLTEETPTIKPYNEAAWAELSDTRNVPINISLTLLHSLHARWYDLMKNMTPGDWNRNIFHPDHKRTMSLWNLLSTYSWHGRHHVAHITALRRRMKWEL